MSASNQLLVFCLDEQRYGLPLDMVGRVVRVVDITPLPKAPDVVLGVINVQGRIIPVINLRRRFGRPDRKILLSDVLIVSYTCRRPVALVADSVTGVIDCSEQDIVRPEAILPAVAYIDGVVKLKDGLILIQDIDKFLSLEEEESLVQALATA